MRHGLCVLLAWLSFSVYADMATELYQPSYKTAEVLIAALEPIYEDEARFSTDGQKIIIRASQAVIDQVLELVQQLDHRPKQFKLEVSSTPTQTAGKSFSTKSRSLSHNTFSLVENVPLTVVKEQQSRQPSAIGPLWIRMENEASEQEYLQLKIHSAGDQIYVDFEWKSSINGRYNLMSNRITGSLHEWLPVTGDGVNSEENIRKWSTSNRGSSGEQLYIKVSPAY